MHLSKFKLQIYYIQKNDDVCTVCKYLINIFKYLPINKKLHYIFKLFKQLKKFLLTFIEKKTNKNCKFKLSINNFKTKCFNIPNFH